MISLLGLPTWNNRMGGKKKIGFETLKKVAGGTHHLDQEEVESKRANGVTGGGKELQKNGGRSSQRNRSNEMNKITMLKDAARDSVEL